MPSEAILSIDGQRRELNLRPGRFTIGRSPDNDLFIDDPGLSRRHAIIDSFDGIVQISDCGSRNGTFVNEAEVRGAVMLRDGDEISLGDVCTLTVRIKSERPGSWVNRRRTTAARTNDPVARTRSEGEPSSADARKTDYSILSSRTVFLPVLALLLLLAAFTVVLRDRIASGGGTSSKSAAPPTANPAKAIESADAPSPQPNGSTGEFSRDDVEGAAKQVLKQISNDDQSYEFPPEVVSDISAQIEQLRSSPVLVEAIRQMAPNCERIAAQARSSIDPGLVVYTGMTEAVVAGEGSKSVQAAQRCLPVMTDIWKLLGNRTADDALLLIAAYRIGPVTNLDRSGRKSHPLLPALRRLSQGVSARRTVWYLYSSGGIDKRIYDFVISFLSVAVMSSRPNEFGVAAAPLVF